MSSYIDFLAIPKGKKEIYEKYIKYPDGCFDMAFDEWLFENTTVDLEAYGGACYIKLLEVLSEYLKIVGPYSDEDEVFWEINNSEECNELFRTIEISKFSIDKYNFDNYFDTNSILIMRYLK